jgi:zinc/manganese transport system substrate-binding protein
MNKNRISGIAAIIAIGMGGFLVSSCRRAPEASTSNGLLQIVAAENFWGSLISQLGGDRVRVTSVISDPNADPHEYESNAGTARAFANADYVIINGAGYDSWSGKLLNAGVNPHRKVLNVAGLLGKKAGNNPHFWYNPAYVNRVVAQMEHDLIALDPADADYFRQRDQALKTALAQYQNRIAAIRKQFSGTKVAATEDIFVYLAKAAGLDLISPPAFMQAVAEGNEPPAQSIVEFHDQLESKEPAVLVYNRQTVTPLTEGIKKLAADEGIPVVGITETVQPPDASFQKWMDSELISLQNALNAKVLGK